MTFRADEARSIGAERARSYLVPRTIEPDQRAASETAFLDIIDELGPVIESYPSWHPLVGAQTNPESPSTTPDRGCGYKGLDHTVYFAKGFVTCPYDDGQEVMDAVDELPAQPDREHQRRAPRRTALPPRDNGSAGAMRVGQAASDRRNDPEVEGGAPAARAGAPVLAMVTKGRNVGDDAAVLPGTPARTAILAVREPGNRTSHEEGLERTHQHRDVRSDQGRLRGVAVRTWTFVLAAAERGEIPNQ